jgi:transposase InsO family protein
MADVTEIPSRFRIFRFHLAVILDVFSRMPLAWKVFFFKPSSRAMARLLRSAVRRFGVPRFFVSDHGTEFTGSSFRRSLQQLGIQHRFGAIGKTGSIAIIERLWKTLKQAFRDRYSAPPLRLAELEERLRLELLYYTNFRPHQALDGATPAEVYRALLRNRAITPVSD